MKENVQLKLDIVKKSWKRTAGTSNIRPYPLSLSLLERYSGGNKIRGQFNGMNVVIHKYEHMVTVYSAGFFGKGSLSRSTPLYKRRKEKFKNASKEVEANEKEDCHMPLESKSVRDKSMMPDSCQVSVSGITPDSVSVQSDPGKTWEEHSALPEPKDSALSSASGQGNPGENMGPVKSENFENATNSGEYCTLPDPKPSIPSVPSDCGQGDPPESLSFVKSENCENTRKRRHSHAEEDAMDTQSECLEVSVRSDVVLKEPEFLLKETLQLNLEEAFFLAYGLGCLQIVDVFGKELSLLDTWSLFCQSQHDFIQKYVVYHYFRAKGWVVKHGLKFGGDFLLYKHGPVMTHASYLVIIEVANEKGEVNETHNLAMSWIQHMRHNRVAENAGKDVLLCRVIWPKNLDANETNSPNILKQFSVQESLLSRWVSSEERERLDQDL